MRLNILTIQPLLLMLTQMCWLELATPCSVEFDEMPPTLEQSARDRIYLYLMGTKSEPPRVCRRLQQLREWSDYEQDNEQVFT